MKMAKKVVRRVTKTAKPPESRRESGGRRADGKFAAGNTIGEKTRYKPGQSGNPSGRPSKFAELRELFQQIGAEQIVNHPQGWTQIERMIRLMFMSKSATDRQNVLEFGWGKVPNQHEISRNLNVYDPTEARAELARRLAGIAARTGTDEISQDAE
jgi:hypothetical protein